MKRMAAKTGCLLLAALAGTPGMAHGADDLGRLFTTPRERAQLDEARRTAPENALPAPVVMPQTRTGQTTVNVDNSLTVRGLVKRNAGRSTAWVNDSNSYEGDLSSGYRQVDRSGIAGDEVTLTLPDGESSVKMKVGQTFDPASARIHDLGTEPDPASAATAVPADAQVDEE